MEIEETIRNLRREGRLDEALSIGLNQLGEFNNENAITYSWLAKSSIACGNFMKANSYLKKKLRIYFHLIGREKLDVAWTYDAIGENLRMLNEHEKAREYYDKALAILQKLYGPNHKYIANVLDHKAESFAVEDNLIEATGWFMTEVDNLRHSDGCQIRDISDVYYRLSELYMLKGDYHSASKYGIQAVKETSYNHKKARIYRLLGINARMEGNHLAALNQFKKELSYHGKEYMPLEIDLGINYLDIGRELNALGRLSEAQRSLAKGFKIYQPILQLRVNNPEADSWAIAESYEIIGRFHVEMGNLTEGIKHFKKAITHYGSKSQEALELRQEIIALQEEPRS